jgi:hypothetical protein
MYLGSMELTDDAILFLISGIILFIVLVLNYGITIDNILILCGYILATIRLTCMIRGSCYFYSRIIAISTFILTGIIILDLPNIQKVTFKNVPLDTIV